MGSKIAAAAITLLLTLVSVVIAFIFMLVVMNGFSERDANWGIAVYVLMVFGVALFTTVSAAMIAGRLLRREMHAGLAALLAIIICSFVGAGLVAASGFAGVIVADIVRRNR